MIDSHSHLYFDRFDDDREEVLRRAAEAGVREHVLVGIDEASCHAALDLAATRPELHATAGLHPASHVEDPAGELERVIALIHERRSDLVALGEIGLDYHWKDVTPEIQHERLRRQLELALELDLPVIYHVREALADHFEILEELERQPPGVFHCFGGGPREAERALELGYHVSFAGNVTLPRSEELREAARVVPLERLLLETDAPFMAPVPRRGRRNEPAYLVHTRDFLADLLDVDPVELGQQCEQNTRALFRLKG